MGLGAIDTLGLADARHKASELKRDIRNGIDPIEARRAEKVMKVATAAQPKMPTFEQCTRACMPQRQQGTSARHQDQTLRRLEQHAFPKLGKKPIDKIVVQDVIDVLSPIWTDMHVTAIKLRSAMRGVFGYAVMHKYRADNPAEWTGLLDNVLAKSTQVHSTQHLISVGAAGMPAFMARLRKHQGAKYRATEFHALVGVRPVLVRDAPWSEFPEDRPDVWEITDWRSGMKTHDGMFRVPLSPRAQEIIAEMRALRQNDYVFPGDKAARINLGAMLATTKEVSGDKRVTAHGARTAMRSWATADKSLGGWNEPNARELAEVALTHKFYSETEKTYQRGDLFEQRRAMMNAWADYCGQ